MTTTRTLATFKSGCASKMMWLIVIAFGVITISGCSQSVDEIKITGPGKPPADVTNQLRFVFNTDIIGTSLVIPVSASRVLNDNVLGANSLRTTSSSPSLQMTSGIGIE